jgi:hypothetical protein
MHNCTGLSPYDGMVYHESPLLITLFSALESLLAGRSALLLYIGGDLLTCAVLARLGGAAARAMLAQQQQAVLPVG